MSAETSHPLQPAMPSSLAASLRSIDEGLDAMRRVVGRIASSTPPTYPLAHASATATL